MATAKELEKQINDTQKVIDAISGAEVTANDSYLYNGKSYTFAQLDELFKPYEDRLKALKKVYAPYASAKAQLLRAKEIAKNPIAESPTGLSQADADKAVKDAETLVATETKSLRNVAIPKNIVAKVEVSTPADSTALGPYSPEYIAKNNLTMESSASPKPVEKKNEKTGGGGGGLPSTVGSVAGETTVKGGKNYVWNGSTWVPQGKLSTESVIAKFKSMFPSQAWIADIDPGKYPDVRSLLERAVTGRMHETQAGQLRFKTEFESTDFYTELKTDNQVKNITALVGDLGFDTVPFNQFLTTSMNMGWKGEDLKANVYKEVFRKNDSDAFVNPTAIERVKKSNPYLSVAKIGKEYFSTVDDTTIQRVLTGDMITDDVQRQQRELAKTKYGHLANLIDQGFSLQQLASPFQQQAAQLLEKSPDAIDMSQANFEAAYNFGEPGQKRIMTQGEWEIALRSDAKYGWDKTNNAKAEARQLASSIAQAFGRIM